MFSRRKLSPEGRAREAARAEHALRYEAESAPVIAALRADGLQIKRLPQLHSGELDPYDAHLPVLIEWLDRASFPAVVESLARALTVRAARGTAALPVLARALRRLPADETVARQAVASAIVFLAGTGDFELVSSLLREPAVGAELMRYFARLRSKPARSRAAALLREFEADPELGPAAQRVLAKLAL